MSREYEHRSDFRAHMREPLPPGHLASTLYWPRGCLPPEMWFTLPRPYYPAVDGCHLLSLGTWGVQREPSALSMIYSMAGLLMEPRIDDAPLPRTRKNRRAEVASSSLHFRCGKDCTNAVMRAVVGLSLCKRGKPCLEVASGMIKPWEQKRKADVRHYDGR